MSARTHNHQRRDLDPLNGMTVEVLVEGIAVGFFQSVEGLGARMGVIEVEEALPRAASHKLAEQPVFSNCILKRGFCIGPLFETLMGFDGAARELDITLTVHDEVGQRLMAWTLHRLRPLRCDAPQLQDGQAALVVAALECSYEAVTDFWIDTTRFAGDFSA